MSQHSGKTTGEGIGSSKLVTTSDIELEQAHLYVLHNADEVEPYVEKRKEILQNSDPNRSENNDVALVAESVHISSSKHRNPAFAKLSYFGVIECIWELDYSYFQVLVFGCKWVDNNN